MTAPHSCSGDPPDTAPPRSTRIPKAPAHHSAVHPPPSSPSWAWVSTIGVHGVGGGAGRVIWAVRDAECSETGREAGGGGGGGVGDGGAGGGGDDCGGGESGHV